MRRSLSARVRFITTTVILLAALSGSAVAAQPDKANDEPAAKAEGKSSKTDEKSAMLKWAAEKEQESEASQESHMTLDLSFSNGSQQHEQKVDMLTKIECTETILEVKDGRPLRVSRTVTSAKATTKDPSTGKLAESKLPFSGLEAEMTINDKGQYSVVSVKKGEKEAADLYAKSANWFSVLPDRKVNVGDKWSVTGPNLAALLEALNSKSGEAEMTLSKVYYDKDEEETVAQIDGAVKCKIQLEADGPTGDMEGKLSERFLPESGLPISRHFKGQIKIDMSSESEGTPVQVKGSGEFEVTETQTYADGEEEE